MKWKIWKEGPRDWRLSRNNKVWSILHPTHQDAVSHLNNIVQWNSHPIMAA